MQIIYQGVFSRSKPAQGKGRAGEGGGLGRERRHAAMQSKLRPEVTPQGVLKLRWPFRVVLSWEEGAPLDAGCPRKGCNIGWNSCEDCQLTSFPETAGEINPAVLKGGAVAWHTAFIPPDII